MSASDRSESSRLKSWYGAISAPSVYIGSSSPSGVSREDRLLGLAGVEHAERVGCLVEPEAVGDDPLHRQLVVHDEGCDLRILPAREVPRADDCQDLPDELVARLDRR